MRCIGTREEKKWFDYNEIMFLREETNEDKRFKRKPADEKMYI